MKRSRVALVVAIAVILVVVVIAFFAISERTTSNQCSSSTGTNLITMFGRLTLPSESTGSNFTLTVINGTCSPITGITVTSVEPQLVGVANASFISYNNSIISALTPLPAGQLGTGSLALSGITAGQRYDFSVTVDFSSGTPSQTETIEIYPQV